MGKKGSQLSACPGSECEHGPCRATPSLELGWAFSNPTSLVATVLPSLLGVPIPPDVAVPMSHVTAAYLQAPSGLPVCLLGAGLAIVQVRSAF